MAKIKYLSYILSIRDGQVSASVPVDLVSVPVSGKNSAHPYFHLVDEP